jgi:hypothetical protein
MRDPVVSKFAERNGNRDQNNRQCRHPKAEVNFEGGPVRTIDDLDGEQPAECEKADGIDRTGRRALDGRQEPAGAKGCDRR